MANNDRVADVYYGRIHSAETQQACRDRIHWLCERVTGRRVLDIGCSQGVSTLILAREGCEVIGLDIEPEPLAVARQALKEEAPQVRERVQFVLGDAFTTEFEAASFDAVVLGEVLEHLRSPSGLLERVSQWLRDGGRLVLSVPYGYHPYHDHKRSFYLSSLLELLEERFSVAEVDLIADGYLCAVAVKPPTGQTPQAPEPAQLRQWQRQCREVLERRERTRATGKGSRESAHVEAKVDRLNQRLATTRENLAAARDQVNRLRRLQRDAEHHREALRRNLADARERRQAAERARQQEHVKATALQRSLQTERQERRRALAQTDRLREQVEFYKAELKLREQEVRYRLGDALVRAARPSSDTLKLPFRIVRLFLQGLRQRKTRAAEEHDAEKLLQPRRTAAHRTGAEPVARTGGRTAEGRGDGAGDDAASVPSPTPPLVEFEPVATLTPVFAGAPREQIVRPDLRIASVTDEFSWRAWQYEANLRTFTPDNWREVLEDWRPDLLLIESTWKGIDNQWHFQLRDLGQRPDEVSYYAMPDVVAWCRQRAIPTVFYNKEDPPNFEFFIDAARLFDFVFTSDANCIDDYRRHVGHSRIFALPFAAQPRLNNPLLTGPRSGSVCFAGTWYHHRHFQRQDAAPAILRPALDFDLHIFDRMAHSNNKNYQWPEIYQPALRGGIPYAQMLTAYKRYKVFLNINSVANSPTMFARRVFELLACGTPVISSYSEGIEELLGDDLVLMSTDEATTRKHLERLLGDDEFRERLALRGQRKVFAEHTYTHRLQTVLDSIGLERPRIGPPRITMLAPAETPEQVLAAWENYRRQEYEGKRLMLCGPQPAAFAQVDRITGSNAGVQVTTRPDASWGPLIQAALKACAPGHVALLNPVDYYGPDYLTDYAHALRFVTEPAIGKATFYRAENGHEPSVVAPGHEHQVTEQVNPWTLCLPHERVIELATRLGDAQTAYDWCRSAVQSLGRFYSSDRFGFVQQGAGTPTDAATPSLATAVPADSVIACA